MRIPQTLGERLKAARAVNKLARELITTLDETSTVDFFELLVGMGARPNEPFAPASYPALLVTASELLIEHLSYLQSRGKGRGRRRVGSLARSLVIAIAHDVRADKIKPSRSERSRFMKICRICFPAAGFEADPAATVRRHLENARAGG